MVSSGRFNGQTPATPVRLSGGLPLDLPWAFHRLYERFSVQPLGVPGAERMELLPTIIPITNMDALLKEVKTSGVTKNLTASAGTYTNYFTVPEGKRWHIWGWYFDGTTGY